MQSKFVRSAVLMLVAAASLANATTGHDTPTNTGTPGAGGGGGGGGGGGAGVAVQSQTSQLNGTVKGTVTGTQNVDLKNVGGVKDSGNSAALAGVKDSGNSTVKNAGNSAVKVRTGDVNTKATGGAGGKSASKAKAASKSGASVGAGAGSANLTTTGGTFESFGVAWAPIVHGGVASVPSASVAVIPGVCGPLLRTYEQPIMGTIVQSDGTTTQTPISYRTVAAPLGNWDGSFGGPLYRPFIVANVAGELVLEGSMVNSFAAVTSTSASVSFSFGLFHKGDAIQAGAAKSDAIQQLIIQERVVPCIYARPAAPITPVQMQQLLPHVSMNNGG